MEFTPNVEACKISHVHTYSLIYYLLYMWNYCLTIIIKVTDIVYYSQSYYDQDDMKDVHNYVLGIISIVGLSLSIFGLSLTIVSFLLIK